MLGSTIAQGHRRRFRFAWARNPPNHGVASRNYRRDTEGSFSTSFPRRAYALVEMIEDFRRGLVQALEEGLPDTKAMFSLDHSDHMTLEYS